MWFPFSIQLLRHPDGALDKVNCPLGQKAVDLLSVAEETAVGAVDLFLYDKKSPLRGVITNLFHEGAVVVVLDGAVFFECQHSVLFSAKVGYVNSVFKSLQTLQRFGRLPGNVNSRKFLISKLLQTLQRFHRLR